MWSKSDLLTDTRSKIPIYFMFTSVVIVSNASPQPQEMTTFSYTITVTKMDEMSINKTFGLTTSSQLQIPFASTQTMLIEFSSQQQPVTKTQIQ